MYMSIPKISDTDPANAATFNKPLIAIEEALASLSGSAPSRAGNAVILENMPLHSSVLIGDAVYFDSLSGSFKPAVATVHKVEGGNGRYEGTEESLVLGVVVKKITPGIGDILSAGSIESEQVAGAVAPTGETGVYFLSPDNPGKLTMDPGHILRQPVMAYMGGSTIVAIPSMSAPYQYTSPIVRTIKSDTIDVDIIDGMANIEAASLELSEPRPSGTAISNVTGKSASITPVVSKIIGTGDISVTTKEDTGEVYLGSNGSSVYGVDAYEYNLNGAKRSSNNLYTYIVFPAGKSSFVTIHGNVHASGECIAKVWVDVVSDTSCQIEARSAFIPTPTEDGVALPTDADLSASTISVSENGSKLCRIPASSGINITGSGSMIATLIVDNPASDIRILKAGFILSPVE